jgi:hypothetical protein
VGPVDDAQRDDDVKVRMIVKSENDGANDRDRLELRLPRHSFNAVWCCIYTIRPRNIRYTTFPSVTLNP